MRTLELAILLALCGLLIGCAGSSSIQNAEQFALDPAPPRLRHEARRHVDHDQRMQDVTQSIGDTSVAKLAPSKMPSPTTDDMDCTSIPVGAERALCLD